MPAPCHGIGRKNDHATTRSQIFAIHDGGVNLLSFLRTYLISYFHICSLGIQTGHMSTSLILAPVSFSRYGYTYTPWLPLGLCRVNVLILVLTGFLVIVPTSQLSTLRLWGINIVDHDSRHIRPTASPTDKP